MTTSWQTPGSVPSRRVYTITEAGVEALELMAGFLSQRAASMQRLAEHAAEAAAEAALRRAAAEGRARQKTRLDLPGRPRRRQNGSVCTRRCKCRLTAGGR